MKLIVTSFVTVDGVIEGPGHDEHRDGKNAWALRVQNEEDGWFNRNHVFKAEAFLLGRKTYQIWAAFWPTATGDEELARRVNEIPKYVVSATLKKADWNNTTLISGEVVREITPPRGGLRPSETGTGADSSIVTTKQPEPESTDGLASW